MTLVFEGNYYDGINAVNCFVNVVFNEDSLKIYNCKKSINKIINHKELSKTEFIGNNRILIRLNKDTGELLDITSEEFVAAFKKKFPSISGKNFLEKLADSGWKGLAAMVALLIVAVAGLYFFVVPFFGELSARFIPMKYEEQLGETIYGNMIQTYTIDTTKTELVNELIKDVDFQSPYNLKMVVVDFDQKNAFAIPGGYIIIYSGIIDEMKDYPELIGLLAHEVSHVNHRHSLRSIFRSLSGYIFISIILNDINGVAAIILDNLNSFKHLSFSRSLEQEADEEGLKILYHNKIDPNGMVKLFEVLMKDGKNSNELEFLSSHPLTTNRIEYIQSQIKESKYHIKQNKKMDTTWAKLKTTSTN
jgi:predicted Zn-dependent protease